MSRHRSSVRASIFAVGSEHVVSRQGTTDTLERKLAHWLDGHGIFDRHEHTRANQDLTGLGFVAKTRGDIGYRPDGGIVEASFKANGAKRGKSVRYANAEANVVSQPMPLLGQRSDSLTRFERHLHGPERRVVY